MRKFFGDYFTFTRRDRKGVFWLLIIFLLTFLLKKWDENLTIVALQLQIDNFDLTNQEVPEKDVPKIPVTAPKEVENASEVSLTKKRRTQLFDFDPNTIPLEKWVMLGFSEKQAASIVKYRQHGGEFTVKQDLLKLFVVDEEKYRQLEPYIVLPGPPVALSAQDSKLNRGESNLSLNLNTADTTSLQRIKGVGSFYSRKIVELRESLGGFTDYSQLEEIWKIRPETIQAIRENSTIEGEPRKIEINLIEADSLSVHPYIDRRRAEAIVAYRSNHGHFHGWDELLQCAVVDTVFQLKLMPYIAFDVRKEN